jgi:hypothetical protein
MCGVGLSGSLNRPLRALYSYKHTARSVYNGQLNILQHSTFKKKHSAPHSSKVLMEVKAYHLRPASVKYLQAFGKEQYKKYSDQCSAAVKVGTNNENTMFDR